MIKKNPSKSSAKREQSYHLSLPGATKMFRPTWAEINRDAFTKNIQKIRSLLKPQTKILAVVKANAYGHTALPISKLAEKSVSMLGVSSIEEGIALRAGGIRKDILILGSIYPLENLTEV
ncbi:MAG: alanine racemase, partial [Elusimicrobia bacterium]|nr:alanine racemase [Elusimicrobiota bacterium]